MTLGAYVVVTVAVLGYTLWSFVTPDRSPYSFLNGVALTATALVSPFVYLSVFKDAIHIFHSENDWVPSWPRYFAFGFGVPLVWYALVTVVGSSFSGTPLVLVGVLVLSTATMSVVYLYQRHRHIGLP
jgi:hypothetical protein